jgi:SAM-dependent methyltransferase
MAEGAIDDTRISRRNTMAITYDALRQDCNHTLDRLLDATQRGLVAPAMLALIDRAEAWRRAAPRTWRVLVDEVIAQHPFVAFARRCPMTERARSKPRGYAGDAVMLDYIYDRERFAERELQGADRAIFRTVAESPTCASVDYRRQLIAERIDTVAREHAARGEAPPSILSLACGHARELDLLATARETALGRIVMCDQDSDSLGAIRQRFAKAGDKAAQVQTRALTVRQFLALAPETQALGAFDLVYSAGLYDYLEQRTAMRLTKTLFDRVAPGGRLLLANFHPANRGTGYMEAFMDWWLIYRDEHEMRAVADEVDPSQVASSAIELDPFGNVVYLTLTKRR